MADLRTCAQIHPDLVLAGDPRLREPSAEVTGIADRTDELKTVLALMREVLWACRSVGIETYAIAAPQVGRPMRLFLISSPAMELVAINPVVTKATGRQVMQEGCLSFPVGTGYPVARPDLVKFRYHDLDGNQRAVKFHDFYARMACHEIDHLDGILIDDHTEYTKA